MTTATVTAPHLAELTAGWSLWRLAGLRGSGFPAEWLALFAGFASGGDAGCGDVPDDALRDISARAVRAVLSQPSFLEALTWQNAPLARNWVGEYAKQAADGAEPSLSRRDQREALIASLVQRYCAKNETIGFFGPVAWARFADASTGICVHGAGDLASRTLYLETWAAAAIADRIAADERLAHDLEARRHPACTLRGQELLRPRREPVTLPADAVAVYDALSSPVRVGDLASRCTDAGLDGPAVTASLHVLQEQGAVLIGWPVPIQERPEQRLRALVDGVADTGLRAELRSRLDGLDAALDAVSQAAGKPRELLCALDGLEAKFCALTGQAGRRDKPGRRFGRCLVYEDCRRDITVTIGADLLNDLRAPLGLLLDSARWLVAELGYEVESELLARHRDLAGRRARPVSLADLVLASGDILNGLQGTAVHRVVEDFQARWSGLLATADHPPGERARQLRTDAVRPLANALFAPTRAAWRAARQHSPDLMLAATPGRRPVWVLGEMHLALNTLENRPFLTQAQDRTELLDATAADFRGGRILPVYPSDAPEVTSRTYPPPAMDLPERYHYWSYTRDEGHPLITSALPGAGLLLEQRDGRLTVRLPDDSRATALEFLGEFLTALAVNRFQIEPAAPHRSRLLLDDMVIGRESWQVPLSEVPLPGTADYGCRDLRRWLAGLGSPRLTFARCPGQPKPWMVDRDSPLSLRNLARAARSAGADDPGGTLTLTEMLPAPDQLWLSDHRGSYTSELRVVAVDGLQTNEPVITQ